MQQLFVYGTLLFPELVTKITGKSFNFTPAILQAYKRYLVKGYDYPAIVKIKGETVEGLLLFDVDEKSMQEIMYFEGNEYKKTDVSVIVNGKEEKAVTFVWEGDLAGLDKNDWDLQNFRKNFLKLYI